VRKHSFDLVSCLAGLLFVGLAAAYIIGAYTDIRIDPRLVLPIVLVGLGLGGLAASLLAQRRSDDAVAAAQSGDSLSR
jgi:ABC-type branched-subunit amino acid transport system permease subunit